MALSCVCGNEYARQEMLQKLHHDVQNPDDFIALVRAIGRCHRVSGKGVDSGGLP